MWGEQDAPLGYTRLLSRCAEMAPEALLTVRPQDKPNLERAEAAAEKELHVAQVKHRA